MIEDLWYKNAVVYCLDVETFMDGNGDGVGDFQGLERRLDYLAGLGINCLWLLPFYPSPNRDNGYDITDFYGVDPRLGDPGDFVAFSHQCRQRGMRLIIDLVVNHTSDRHPWFQAARKRPDSPYRDYYLWSEKKPKDAHKGMVFPGVQKATWTYDAKARAYYFHRFHSFQPDLNVANPEVRRQILKVMGHWLELGVSGFRVDAVPFLIEHKGPPQKGQHADPYTLLEEMRDFLSWRRGDAILLAEANVPYEDALEFFGDEGDRMQLVFNFLANQHLFAALAQGSAEPLAEVLRQMPRLPPVAQWANFVRNHDELDLGRLPEDVRQGVFDAFGHTKDAQLYGRGLRRRLAAMLQGDRRRMELVFALMLGLPGTPVYWYGDELGMGDLLSLPDRAPVRTPMQWSAEAHAGFTRGRKPFRPVVAGGDFGYGKVNVAAARRDPGSFLNWNERMVRLRKECPEVGWGSCRVLEQPSPEVLALRYEWRGGALVLVFHFGGTATSVKLDPGGTGGERLVDLLTGEDSRPGRGRKHALSLEGYGYRWFRAGDVDASQVLRGP
jgi:maltose alpha-D-glucosyltransferase/alpha-amylase